MVDTTSRTVKLGDRDFDIPMLPPKANRKVYPLCVKLEPVVRRTILGKASFKPTEDEYADVLQAVFQAISYRNPITEDEFMEMPVPPQQHFDALLIVRLQTGGWVIVEKGDTTSGETPGMGRPQE